MDRTEALKLPGLWAQIRMARKLGGQSDWWPDKIENHGKCRVCGNVVWFGATEQAPLCMECRE